MTFLNKKNKNILVIAIIFALAFIFLYLINAGFENESNNKKITKEFIECLDDAGVVIYGSKYCPACNDLIDDFGGYDMISPIYVECEEDMERCKNEMKGEFVPEIQVKNKLYKDIENIQGLSEKTECSL